MHIQRSYQHMNQIYKKPNGNAIYIGDLAAAEDLKNLTINNINTGQYGVIQLSVLLAMSI